jgi:tetratricopeptide (TPR) repeat protein
MAVLILCGGCKKAADPQVFVSAQDALEDGIEAYKDKDYQAAVESLNTALSGGGLLPDLYSEALLKRAECLARVGDSAAALADLDTAARGADMAEVHRVRSFVYAKQGNSTQSRAEMTAARRINPQIKAIAD